MADRKTKRTTGASGVEGINPYGWKRMGYVRYTEDPTESIRPEIIALNQAFPSMVGYGIYQYLKQRMAMSEKGKILWSDSEIRVLSLQTNTTESVIRNVVDFCVNTIKVFVISRSHVFGSGEYVFYLLSPKLLDNLMSLEVRRIRGEVWYEDNGAFIDNKIINVNAQKTEVVDRLMGVLVLTDEIKDSIEKYYPKMGGPEKAWSLFMQDINDNYMKWDALVTEDNYDKLFYAFLNNAIDVVSKPPETIIPD